MRSGFTYLEILMVMMLLTIVIAFSLSRLDLGFQLSRSRNYERQAEVRELQIALDQYRRDNDGEFPSGVSETNTDICVPGCTESSSRIDISNELAGYLENGIPVDPQASGDVTGYLVRVTTTGQIIVTASLAENDETILAE